MSAHSINAASNRAKWIAGALVIAYALITMVPLAWIVLTGFKSPADAISYPPKVVFEPTLEGYVNLFTTRTRQTEDFLEANPPENWADEIVRQYDMVIVGPSKFGERFLNSVIIGFGSTFLSVFLGTLAAYAFSRFKIPLADDLLFFILSTRMMPPIAAAIFDERPVTPLSPGMEPEEIFARYPPILESPLYFSQPVAGEVDTYLVIRSTVENDPLHSERTLTQYRCEQQAFR